MFRKILPYTALIVSLLLLITAVIDVFSAITLFEIILFRLAVVAMLLLSFGVTFLCCFSAEMRRPLILLACLLQTPIGGGMVVLLVYNFCFPNQLQMDAVLPLVTLLVAFASAIQAAVLLLCKSIEVDEGISDADYSIDCPTVDDLSPLASAPKRQAKVTPSRSASLDLDAEDELSPIPRKKQRRTAVDLQDSVDFSVEESSEESVSFTTIDLLSLLDEEKPAEEPIAFGVVAEELSHLTEAEAASTEATPSEETAEPAAEEKPSESAPSDAEQSSVPNASEAMENTPVRSDS